MPDATPDDVRGVIDTSLDDPAIASKLADAQFRNEQTNDVSELPTAQIRQIEKYLAAILIRESKDKPARRRSGASRSVEYQGRSLASLRARLDEVDPSGELARSVLTDTDRHVTSTTDS